jgi:molybdopterin converting factor small subunit
MRPDPFLATLHREILRGRCRGTTWNVGEDIRFQGGLDTPVSEGDEVTIVPAVTGGA